MSDALIVEAVRTPIGRRKGMLSGWHPADLLSEVLAAVVARAGVEPGEVDDVIVGCLDQVGEQAINIGRSAALGAGFPETVPATTIDRQCGSSQQAAHFAAQGVMAGAYDIVIAAGVESMTRVPMWSNVPEVAAAYGPRFRGRYDLPADVLIDQGISGELVAERWEIEREELDEFALSSHRRAAAAAEEGRFADEILPLRAARDGEEWLAAADEGVRPDTSLEALTALRPVFREGGRLTAGNSSQISDGAAAILWMSAEKARSLGLRPRARILHQVVVGTDPYYLLDGPIDATKEILKKSGMTLADIDLFEINEAFAAVVLSWLEVCAPDPDRVNVNGGAIALGHPVGATGSRLIVTALNELERRDKNTAFITMCCGASVGTGTIIERL
jgi:acetyl-CoA acetyltransferase family protein